MPARTTLSNGGAGAPPAPPPPPARRREGELRPNAWDPPVAGRTAPVRSDALLLDDVAVALDQQVAAIRAVGVLPAANPAREISRVDEPKPCPHADFTGVQ